MSRLFIVALAAASLAAASAVAAPAPLKGQEFFAQSKISLAQARGIALKARPGKIVDQELEKESGGSGLRFSFDVTSHGKTFEVGVDAMTGKVLENGSESAATEAKETLKEAVKH